MDENEILSPTENNLQGTGVVESVEGAKEVGDKNAVEQQKNSRVIGKPFVKGDPRINRKGAPKKVTIWDYLKEGEDDQRMRDFIEDPKFKDKVAEYILGKPKQPLVGGDENDEPIQFVIAKEIAKKNNINDNSTPESSSDSQ